MTRGMPQRSWVILLMVLFVLGALRLWPDLSTDRLPGHVDAWAQLAMFEELNGLVQNPTSIFTPQQGFLYPYRHSWKAFGLDFGSGILYLPFLWLTDQPFLGFWLTIITICGLNGVAMFILGRELFTTRTARWMVSALLVVHPFILMHLEWPNLLTLFPGILAVSILLRFRQWTGDPRRHRFFYGLCLAQLLLSPYGFILLGITCLFLLPKTYSIARSTIRTGRGVGLLAILVASIVGFTVVYFVQIPHDATNALEGIAHAATRSSWSDIITPPPRHGIWSSILTHRPSGPHNSLFPGLIATVLIVIGARSSPRLAICAGILLVAGSTIGGLDGPQILQSADDLFVSVFRVPSRLNLLVFFFLTCLAGIGIDVVHKSGKAGPLASVVLAVIVIAECLPWSPHTLDTRANWRHTSSMDHHLRTSGWPDRPVVLFLPIGTCEGLRSGDEYIRMFRRHRQNSILMNGNAAYYPVHQTRITCLLQRSLEQSSSDRLCRLLRQYRVNFVINERSRTSENLSLLEVSPCLSIVTHSVNETLYYVGSERKDGILRR